MALPLRQESTDARKSPANLDSLFLGGSSWSEAAHFDWAPYPHLPQPARDLLERLLRLPLLTPLAARSFLDESKEHLAEFTSEELLGNFLVQAGVVTEYQLDRVLAGNTHGLVLGNYRVLRRLGAGNMAVVFLAEHFLMRRRVAVKVLPVDEDSPPELHVRFYSEMQVLADLHHPNIVLAYDAGELPAGGPKTPRLAYLVMELVDGGDLEQHTVEHGVATVSQACEWIRQAARGLQEAHDHHLVHRDIKPSNLLLTRQGQVKVVDFGLARQASTVTTPRMLLGSVEFMAPEQSRDSSTVGPPADIYGLGATLFWLLTGELPHSPQPTLVAALRALQEQPPRKLRALRRDAPEALERLVDRMLDRNPSRRPESPLAVMNALSRFATSAAAVEIDLGTGSDPVLTLHAPAVHAASDDERGRLRRVLIVHDDESFCHRVAHDLRALNCECHSTGEGAVALEAMRNDPYELVLIDRKLADMDGYELCRRLRERPYSPNLRLLFLTDASTPEALSDALCHGADDGLPRECEPRQLHAKVQGALHMRDTLDRYEHLARHLSQAKHQLENSLVSRALDVRQAQDALLFAMAKMAAAREGETQGHLRRLQRFSRSLAEHAARDPAWADAVNDDFLRELERCVPLHDIGKIGLPDSILTKPGQLTPPERSQMETHTVIGSDILDSLAREHGSSLSFLGMARVIVRHHHERFDGKGYPDRLAGDDVPHAARLVALADVYDALRRKRAHKPALSHAESARYIFSGSPGQFDPILLQAFETCQRQFERIFREIPE